MNGDKKDGELKTGLSKQRNPFVYLYNLVSLLDKDSNAKFSILSSYLDQSFAQRASQAIKKLLNEIQSEFLADLFTDYRDDRLDKSIFNFFNKELKLVYQGAARNANKYIDDMTGKGKNYLKRLFIDAGFENIDDDAFDEVYNLFISKINEPDKSFSSFISGNDKRKLILKVIKQNREGFVKVFKTYKTERNQSGPTNESKQDNISNLLENLVNNYINQRKQQWQKRTT